jgi:RNA polymerase sigma-70 factor (ECF subfamily)
VSTEPGETGRVTHDAESRLWVEQLRSGHPRHEEAVGKLHGVLVRVAFDELSRRRGQLGAIAGPEYDDLAQQAADGALMNILRKLDEFRGLSRFTTWAFRFVIFEVASKVARDAWRRQPPSSDQLAWGRAPRLADAAPGRAPRAARAA